jgi:hypothetical protein
MLPIWLPGYVQLRGGLPADVINALLEISPPTIDRILKPIRFHYTKRGRSTTKPGTLLRKQAPSPSKPISGMNRGRASSKPIPSPTAAIPLPEGTPIPSTSSISPPAGQNNAPYGERAKPASFSKSNTSKKPSRSPSSASIAITAVSSSTGPSSDTSPKENIPSSSPEAGPITKMTTPISNRKTGHTSDSGSATTA